MLYSPLLHREKHFNYIVAHAVTKGAEADASKGVIPTFEVNTSNPEKGNFLSETK